MATKNNFQIVISANDRATASIRRINTSMERMVRPVSNVQRSMRSLTREVGKNVAVKALSGVSRAAEGAASSISKIVAPMSAVIGIGSIAGMVALVNSWGKLGIEVSQTAGLLGTGTAGLQSLRGAAELAGLSSNALTGGLTSLRQVMHDAKWSRNPDIINLMDRVGIKFRTTSTGAIDVVSSLKDVADAIAAQPDIGAKHTIAQAFGLEGLLPLLMKGAKGMEELEQRAKSLGLVLDGRAIEAAKRYGESILQLEGSLTGLRYSITGALAPAFTPLINQFTKWIELNRDPIAKALGDGMERLVKWVKQLDFTEVLKDIKEVGNSILFIATQINSAADAMERFNKRRLDDLDKYGWHPKRPAGAASASSTAVLPSMPPGTSSAGWGRGVSPGSPGVDPRSLGYNHPLLNAYAAQVEQANKLPPGLLNAIKNYGERSGSLAVSPKGARGMMQFMPDTWKKFGAGDPTDPYASIDAAGRYFKDMLGRYGGNVDAAITEYNGGTKQAKAVQGGGQPWVAETANYLSRVKAGMGGEAASSKPQELHVTFDGLPTGVTAKVRTGAGQAVPVRINHSMNTLSAG
jgi:hypothetical protein